MGKKLFLPLSMLILVYGFYKSSNFQEIAAGVAIFLFGMLLLEQGFKTFSGGILDKILKYSTNRLYKSLAFGVVSTSIMQSSSLVSILTISFLGAGLLTLSQGIGVIFGANLGTTTGAWLVAGYGLKINIGAYAMPMIVFGTLFVFQKNNSFKGVGYILTGLGFLFLGIHYMKEGFDAFKGAIDLSSYAVGGYKGLVIFTIMGIVATVVMQSSHATLVLIITALSAGQVSYENALALAIGANVGTTITAILGAMSSNIEGKRLAGAHLVFNLVTAIIAVVFISQLVYLVNESASYLGIAQDDYTLKLAIFHTIFNTIGIVVMIPMINPLVRFLEKVITSDVEQDGIGHDSVLYLNDSALEFPQSAMGAIIREIKHLYDNAFEIIAHGLNLKRGKIVSSMELEEVIKHTHAKKYIDIEAFYEQRIKDIYSEIITFSTQAQTNMSPQSIEQLYKLKLASRDIVEAIKNTKHLQKNIIKFSAHPNRHIQAEYAQIKYSIAELLRNINIIATTDEEDVIILLLSKIRVNTQKYDIIANGKLDELIRNHNITNQMATSLMNDSVYVYNIRNKLCNMAEILFIEANSDLKNLHDELHITQGEIEELLEKKE